MNPLWGIDLGGTKIEGAIIESAKNAKTLARLRIPTEQEGGYQHIIQQICKLVELLKQETGLSPERIGIGTPGSLNPQTQLMKNSNTTCLNEMPLKQDLEAALQVPIAMANDANCFAVAEAVLGIVPDHLPNAEVVFGVIMGTGVGGGVVVRNKVINGRQGIGGEWGHNFLDESGGLCYCGLTGCVEQVLSGPALEKYYKSLTGNALRMPAIVAAHHAGTDNAATQTMQRLTHFFGRAIATVINIIDPDAIVIGGGVGNIDLIYSEGVAVAKKHIFNTGVDRLDTLFMKPKLGDSAGVFGAALLVA